MDLSREIPAFRKIVRDRNYLDDCMNADVAHTGLDGQDVPAELKNLAIDNQNIYWDKMAAGSTNGRVKWDVIPGLK